MGAWIKKMYLKMVVSYDTELGYHDHGPQIIVLVPNLLFSISMNLWISLGKSSQLQYFGFRP